MTTNQSTDNSHDKCNSSQTEEIIVSVHTANNHLGHTLQLIPKVTPQVSALSIHTNNISSTDTFRSLFQAISNAPIQHLNWSVSASDTAGSIHSILKSLLKIRMVYIVVGHLNYTLQVEHQHVSLEHLTTFDLHFVHINTTVIMLILTTWTRIKPRTKHYRLLCHPWL